MSEKNTLPLSEKKLFLLDMDGTIYIDDYLFPSTLEFLAKIKENGGRYIFLTNNSSRGIDEYVKKLARMGIAATADDFVSSVDVTIEYLLEHHKNDIVYSIGTRSFRAQLAAAGVNLTDDINADIACFVSAFDTELTFEKIKNACIILGRDVDYIAANPDYVCPTAFGSVPDCGALSEMLYHSVKKMPRFIGKPAPDIVYHALKVTGYEKKDAVVIGDRLYTDIACGNNAGIDSILVLSGESTLADITEESAKPTYIYDSIADVCREITKEN